MNKSIWILIFLAFLTVIPRLYKIQSPPADWHSFRQVDTAAVARNFIKFGFDPLRPRYDDLSNIQSGKENPQGWRMVEFPIYQLTAAGLFKLTNTGTIEIWLRIVNIFAAVVGMAAIFGLLLSLTDLKTATYAGIFYAILPYNIFYNRAILPETFAVMLSLLSVYSLHLFHRKLHPAKPEYIPNIYFFGSIFFGVLALLCKPTSVFIIFINAVEILRHFKLRKDYFFSAGLYAVLMLFPVWWWRVWIMQFPEGIPDYSWLFNAGNIRLKGAWFYWLFADRIGNLILGYWGILFFGNGLLSRKNKKEGWLTRWLLAGVFIYFLVIARGNVQHDYYQIMVIPAIAIYCAKGLKRILHESDTHFLIKSVTAIAAIFFMVAFSWYRIRTYYWINRPEFIETGKIADKLLPRNAKVIAPNNGDTTFLYFTNRQGWPIGFDIPTKLSLGATHYVTISPLDTDLETKELAEKYKVLVRNEKYAIIDLTQRAR